MSEDKEKIPLKIVKKMPWSMLNRIINKAKKQLKTNEIWIKICKEYNETPDIIDLIPTYFDDLDVSAKTIKGVVVLNYTLLCDGDFEKDQGYLIHEYSHFFQQCYGKTATQSADDGDYLHNEYEQEGFANQIEFIADQQGEQEAEKYTDDLLDHHDKNGKEADKLKDTLMDQV